MRTIAFFVLAFVFTPRALLAQGERFTLSGGDIAIYNLAGEIRADAGTGLDVTAEITRSGPDAAKLKVETGRIGSRNTLRVIFPDSHIIYPGMGHRSSTSMNVDDDGTFGDGEHGGHRVRITGDGSGLEAAAIVKLSIPAGKRVRLNLGVGQLSVKNVDGELVVDVASADVTTEGTKGSLNLDLGSGTTSVTRAEGRLNLDSGSGEVTITGLKGTLLQLDSGSGDVRATDIAVDRADLDVGSGSVTIAKLSARNIKLDSGSGDVDIGLTGDVDDLYVDSGSGDVTLRIPDTLGAELEVDAGSGGVKADMPITVTRYESDRIVGKLGDGKGRIRIDSGSGEIKLVRAN